ncbi:Methylosome subunit pICln [Balamuthia mandrillaris]
MPLIAAQERRSDGTPVLPEEDEEVRLVQPHATLYLGETKEGEGTLYVTTKHVIWLSAEDESKGYSMDFYYILLHAISRDSSAFPYPCIYCQLDSSQQGEDEEETITDEARFVVPEEKLSSVYDAFCSCAALNPDQVEEDEGEFVFNREEVYRGSGLDMTELQAPLQEDEDADYDGRYDDDEGEEEDGDGEEEQEKQT